MQVDVRSLVARAFVHQDPESMLFPSPVHSADSMTEPSKKPSAVCSKVPQDLPEQRVEKKMKREGFDSQKHFFRVVV